MPNGDISTSGDSGKRNNDVSRTHHDKQDEYARAAKAADKQEIKPKPENRSCSWQNITQAFLKCCGFKGAEEIVLEETTEGDVKSTNIRFLDHRGEWWNRPDHFTLATGSIDKNRIYSALRKDTVKWDRFQENWKKLLERLEQPSNWNEAEPSISKSELDHFGEEYRFAYEEDDGSDHAFERIQKAQKAWDEALRKNNPNIDLLQDKTAVAKLELEHAGFALERALQRSENGTPNLQDDISLLSLHFDQYSTTYDKLLQARNVQEGSQEPTAQKWLRIRKERVHPEKDVRDMFWHDARWAMRNEFLAKKLSDSEKQEEVLARSKDTLSDLRAIYDEAKNQSDNSSDMEYGDLSQKPAEMTRQLKEQDEIFKGYINAKIEPGKDFKT